MVSVILVSLLVVRATASSEVTVGRANISTLEGGNEEDLTLLQVQFKEDSKRNLIQDIRVQEVYSASGGQAVAVAVTTASGFFNAVVPGGMHRDGAWTGQHVMDQSFFDITSAKLRNALAGRNVLGQLDLDRLMMQAEPTNKLGASALLAVSIAICKAAAFGRNIPLYAYIAELAGKAAPGYILPTPVFPMMVGGRQAANTLPIKKIMISPDGAGSLGKAVAMGEQVYLALGEELRQDGYGSPEIVKGGGYAPNIADGEKAVQMLMSAIEKSGNGGKVKIGLDVAASTFYDPETDMYASFFNNPNKVEDKLTARQVTDRFMEWAHKYPLFLIEGPFHQKDRFAYQQLTQRLGTDVEVMIGDLTTPERVQAAIDEKACSAERLDLQKSGSVSAAIAADKLFKTNGWGVVVSEDFGEQDDTFIAHFILGTHQRQMQCGVPSQFDAKLNHMTGLEKFLGDKGHFAGVNRCSTEFK